MPQLTQAWPSWPYRQDAPAQINTGSLRHLLTATATTTEEIITLPVNTCTLTFDDNWAPYAQLQMSIAPLPATTLNKLDPTANTTINLSLGYRYTDGVTECLPIANLHLRSITTKNPGPQIDLTAASNECLLQDAIWPETTPAPIPQTSLLEAITWLIATAEHQTPTIESTTPNTTPTLPDLGILAGTSLWKTAFDLAADQNYWLYHDGHTSWHLQPRGDLTPTTQAQLATGPAGNIIESTQNTNREQWADAILIINKWRDPATRQENEITAKAIATAIPTKWKYYQRQTPTTQALATTAAAEYLTRLNQKNLQTTITAKALYWLRPADTITIDLPDQPQTKSRISRITYTYPAGRMTLTATTPQG